jgi:hypothetical protein
MRKLPQLLLLAALVFPGKVFADELRAGAASVVTTPAVEPFTDANRNQQRDENEPFQDLNGNGQWDPVWLAGYRGDRPALRVHDDLSVRALALSEGKNTVLFIAVDCVGYLFDEISRVKKILQEKHGLDPSRILIAATHDHSGPDTIGLWGPGGKSGRDPAYLAFLRERIVECIDHQH